MNLTRYPKNLTEIGRPRARATCLAERSAVMATAVKKESTTPWVSDIDLNRAFEEMGFEYDVTMVSSYDASYPCENITNG